MTSFEKAASYLQNFPEEAFGQSAQLERATCDLIIMTAPLAPMLASELWVGMRSVPHLNQHYKWVSDPCG